MAEPWVAPLEASDPESAWDLFIERYRRLIFGAIRRYTAEHDEVMDVFARVCEALRENDFARLRRCAAHVEPDRPISTWIVAVVRNLTIDWFRHRDGRTRLSALAESLPPIRKKIFEYVIVGERSHIEAYELLKSRDGFALTYREFLKELNETYRVATGARRGHLVKELAGPLPETAAEPSGDDPAEIEERQRVLQAALETLPPEDRLAVQLYVVDGIPADQVARALGHPSPKTVYNRVYRALALVRAQLEQAGIRSGTL